MGNNRPKLYVLNEYRDTNAIKAPDYAYTIIDFPYFLLAIMYVIEQLSI